MTQWYHSPAVFTCSHAIVSSSVGPEYYVSILSFVDKTQLEPGCSVLMHNKVRRTYRAVQSIAMLLEPFVSLGELLVSAVDQSSCLQVLSVVGLLQDEADPMVSVMKVRPTLCCKGALATCYA